MITINDIAKRAGVAKSTVSRFLNGGSVSEKTKQKIREIIQETGYEPNVFAQSLKAKRTGLIGVIIPRLESAATNSILKGIDDVAHINNQRVLIVNTNQEEQRELEAIRVLARQKVDCIVLIATVFKEEHRELVKSIETPVIVLGQRVEDIPSVSYDDYQAGRLIAEHVMTLGHKKVAYVGVAAEDYAVGYLRQKGVEDTLVERGVELECYQTSFHLKDAYQLGLKILPDLTATYVIAATDNIALGLLKAAYACNKRVPKDFSLSGFGGYESTTAVYPTITTVKFPYEEAGRYVLEKFNQDDYAGETILSVKLLVKKSTDFYENR
ncbi:MULTISPECIES: LacI family DNA-binding transcriptional regulator [unclassified Granulicatella]|uniref:LacI family DNA-binding transcriptional regulator n=1 Tax=unclassified Granulicatella TaxID=2630493 RepID=UPI0010737CAD|nr:MULTISPECIES: LacI family DNA-binding transcriptional regulator [unclassified Granulicatella]MBF0780394.1 LacI family DNA-binding transcriptional regulator [Granulicatella sp. 19428wC4_WM01]TFU95482.1 LacI family transcriptional regulator [Granulicatella sp. WM01]